jgi:drug/metabolite transporter, DME family
MAPDVAEADSAARSALPRDEAAASRLASALAVLAASVLFGTTGTAQALGPRSTTPLGVGAVRLAVGALALVALALARRPAGGRRWWRHAPALFLGGAAVAAYHLAWFTGLRRTGVALGTIVGIGSGPVFSGLIHLLRQRAAPPRAWTIGTALTVAGASLLAARGAAGLSADPLGLACMVAAGLSYAVYAEAAKHALQGGLDHVGAMVGVFTVGAVLMAPLLALEPLGWLATPRGAAMALHLGILTIGLAYWLYGWGLRHLPVPTVVTLTLGEPLTAALLGVVFLGERLGPYGWLGAAVIAAGLVAAGRGETEADRGPAPPTP